jgi:NAD(P)-dependent dehydrogenase (short-subunit alcohol dehydrogenase family)
MRFEGKTVLITGGATGIGRATALAFAREGAAVMIGDVDNRAAETVSLIEAEGGKAAFKKADVSDAQAMTELVRDCVARFGGMDMAFNNAGVLPPPLPFHEVPASDLDHILNVDLKGVYFAMQAEIRQAVAPSSTRRRSQASSQIPICRPMLRPNTRLWA